MLILPVAKGWVVDGGLTCVLRWQQAVAYWYQVCFLAASDSQVGSSSSPEVLLRAWLDVVPSVVAAASMKFALERQAPGASHQYHIKLYEFIKLY